MVLVAVIAGARLLGSRSVERSDAMGFDREAELAASRRAAGFVNRLTVVNMLDVRIMVTVADVDPAEWGRTPADDEPPAGLQAEVVEPRRVSGPFGLRPLRIVDGGGSASFTLTISNDSDRSPGSSGRVPIGEVPTRSNALEFCGEECVDGFGWFDWADAAEPTLDTFRRCVVDERVIGSYVDATGTRREVTALFQCDAARFESALVLFD